MPKPKIKVEIITVRKILPVQPGMLFTSPDRIEIDVCTTCAAVVFDPIAHDTWHRTDRTIGLEGDR